MTTRKISDMPRAVEIPTANDTPILFEDKGRREFRHATIGQIRELCSRYAHRNGETDAPTEPGNYWFDGNHYTNPMQELVSVRFEKFYTYVDRYRTDEINDLDEFSGKWWGPITPPWETNQ